MRKDWVIWISCVCLFVAGMIWGGVPIPTNFFKVQDVHDLFEIAGSGATVLAVCLAAAGLNTWRQEALATSDHDLARRASIVLFTYQSAVVRGYQLAKFLTDRVEREIGKRGATTRQLEGIGRELQLLETAVENARAIALECKVAWGDEVWQMFHSALLPGDKFSSCIEGYLFWAGDDASDAAKDKIADLLLESFEATVPIVGSSKESVESAMQHVLAPLYLKVEEKFLHRNAS